MRLLEVISDKFNVYKIYTWVISSYKNTIKGKGDPIHAMKVIRWSGGIDPLILSLDIRWR
jgi:hypothetical protein